jgi:hypothetical protein
MSTQLDTADLRKAWHRSLMVAILLGVAAVILYFGPAPRWLVQVIAIVAIAAAIIALLKRRSLQAALR